MGGTKGWGGWREREENSWEILQEKKNKAQNEVDLREAIVVNEKEEEVEVNKEEEEEDARQEKGKGKWTRARKRKWNRIIREREKKE